MTMIATPQIIPDRRTIILQWVTLAWMLVECSVALTAAYRANSVSLLAFGSDSFVELLSAILVLLQFASLASALRVSQQQAAKLCGLLLYVLSALVIAISLFGFFRHVQADTSLLGIGITAGALVLMPVIALFKRNEAHRTGNKALRADAVQSATCAYLAALTLGGLLLRAWLKIDWLDQAAALAAVPILISEARNARQGDVCTCC